MNMLATDQAREIRPFANDGPSVRAIDIDELAPGQVREQHTLGFGVDLFPCFRGDRGESAFQQVH
jgi:hypothetical protein